jgi:hypothetical protein
MNTTPHLDIAHSLDAIVPVGRPTRTSFAASAANGWARIAHTPAGRVGAGIGDVLGAVAMVLCIPFVILAIGTPIALCARLLLWVTGSL